MECFVSIAVNSRLLKGITNCVCGYAAFAIGYACLNGANTAVDRSQVSLCSTEVKHSSDNAELALPSPVESDVTAPQIQLVESITPLSGCPEKNGTSKEVFINGEKVTYVEGQISSNFYLAARALNIPQKVIASFVKIMKPKVNFKTGLKVGDQFSVAYTSNGNIIIYLSIKTKKQDLCLYRDPSGGNRYYCKNGTPLDGNSVVPFKKPVDGARISSIYGYRIHPVLKTRKMHNGIDYAAPIGTLVKAPCDGVVKEAGYSRSNGKFVVLKHDGGYESLYAHLSDNSAAKVGSFVHCGSVIGKVGSTGMSTGPHLHFGVKKNGHFINPNSKMNIAKPKLCGGQYNKFKQYVSKVDNVIKSSKENSI